ncbi:hypothetical protein [Pseudoalteromonas marina]|uniref:hypothetical protein n=1 Tax=Pseudoalteromonas marina TaxID=267375 RepID=UPI0023F48FCA|nr:hypothetical protein [Pseudoalteromonas marina]
MLSDADIEISVRKTLERIVPEVNERSWFVEYLYRHKIGNKLPRGKKFDFYRGIENQTRWSKIVNDRMNMVSNKDYRNRISPFLLSQLTLLDYACIFGECQLKTGVVLDVIAKLEGEVTYAPSIDLVKHDIKFKRKGLFSNYKHSHAPMHPNAYLKMMSQDSVIQSIVDNTDNTSLVLDFGDVESGIKSKGKAKGGRMTGHWLITREEHGDIFYIGVFPHARVNGLDENWIFNQVQESERQLQKKHNKPIKRD